jgi:hypothetical protein
LAKSINLNLILRGRHIKLIIPNSRSYLWSIEKVDSIFINSFDPPHNIYSYGLSLFSLIELKKSFFKCLLYIMIATKILFHFCKTSNLWCSESWINSKSNSEQYYQPFKSIYEIEPLIHKKSFYWIVGINRFFITILRLCSFRWNVGCRCDIWCRKCLILSF